MTSQNAILEKVSQFSIQNTSSQAKYQINNKFILNHLGYEYFYKIGFNFKNVHNKKFTILEYFLTINNDFIYVVEMPTLNAATPIKLRLTEKEIDTFFLKIRNKNNRMLQSYMEITNEQSNT